MSGTKYRRLALVCGDILILWVGLLITLLIRYPSPKFRGALDLHIAPFSIVFIIWVVIFYIAGLYEIRGTHKISETLKLLLYAISVGGMIAIALFYFVPYFLITPKINLLLDLIITTGLLILWRILFTRLMKNTAKTRLLLLGSSSEIKELEEAMGAYPELGYEIAARAQTSQNILTLLSNNKVELVVAPKEAQQDNNFVHTIYETLHSGIRFLDAATFYESLMGKIPLSLISKVWFLENIAETEKRLFETAKRAIDIFFALLLGIFSLPLMPVVALAIKLDSDGPIFLKQKRVGKMGQIYTHYKFRTMLALGPDGHAEINGALWAQKGDRRVTRVGKFLRATRIDELPQLWNVLVGELSFVGPRPERPEFVESLRKQIPFYDMRHIVRPGLSGWAQTNPPYYYGTEKEAMLKLQYDLFYIKNRDLGLDLDIALKTLLVIFSARGR